ncbi:MAG: ACP S-malonyltransferase [Actinomycetota bacterium]
MITGLFPGQGLDARHVDNALSSEHPYIADASEVLGTDLPRSIARIAGRSPRSSIPTDLAQVAIFVAGIVAFERERTTTPFERLLGHSLGEYTALVAARAMSFHDALRVVTVRARAMKRAAQASHGGMAAAAGIEPATAREICERRGVFIANDNSPSQLVLAGPERELALAASDVGAAGGRTVLLPVDGAFHTPAMAPAASALQAALAHVDVRSPRIEVISNVTAAPYRSPGEIRKLLVRQLTETVRFRESLVEAVARGSSEFVDLGPGRVVARLADAVTTSEVAHV